MAPVLLNSAGAGADQRTPRAPTPTRARGADTRAVRNFGGAVRFTPRCILAPRDEAEVLEILERHAHQRIRALGSLHSWSDVAVTDGVALDLRHLRRIEIAGHGASRATVGAGLVLHEVLRTLDREAGATLPAFGNIAQQTIAGAISTASHGSGKSSISHYVDEIRMAAYEPQTGRARIYELRAGSPEVRAARCALGCMGVILSVTTRTVPQYAVEETVRACASLDEALATEVEHPLQMVALFPHRWTYVVFLRRDVGPLAGRRTSRKAWVRRVANRVGSDLLSHLFLKHVLLRSGSPKLVRSFYRHVAPHILPKYDAVIDRSTDVLITRHDFVPHEELEVSVPAGRIHEAVGLVRHVTSAFAGTEERVPPSIDEQLETAGLLESLRKLRGTYTHHFPIVIRSVLPDDALISVTGDATEPYYALSFFTYFPARARSEFYGYAAFVARALTRLHQGKLHWGKNFPLRHDEIAHLHPKLAEFREICGQMDPAAVFRNAYAERVLGFGRSDSGT
jgi:L-gulono-1,4-lactone dehydrogenase